MIPPEIIGGIIERVNKEQGKKKLGARRETKSGASKTFVLSPATQTNTSSQNATLQTQTNAEVLLNENVPHLGLVCITHSERVRYRTITRTRLLQFDQEEQQHRLRELYAANLERLNLAIEFCHEHDVKLYRITSGLFPFADDPIGTDVLEEFADEAHRTGRRANETGLRMVLHPDQFVVLSSDSPHVVANSIKILSLHARVMDMLEQPRSEWALMNIHGGKSDREDRLVEQIGMLPDEIRSRVTFENDEHAYGVEQIYRVCKRAGVPFVYDAHHHVAQEKISSYDDARIDEALEMARGTWKNPANQLVHISNGREFFNDARHSDIVTVMPACYARAPFIEIEAKHKENAIQHLQRDWLPTLSGKRI